MKQNRKERVVEEVKLAIKPFYAKGKINKEQYKEIMRKAVPKVCLYHQPHSTHIGEIQSIIIVCCRFATAEVETSTQTGFARI